jgi:small conductance mechanosensitive channel
MMTVSEFGVNVAPLLAGAGVAGLAVGFGAQNLVRDVISGLFILLENQIRVNDVAIINGTGGLVEEINLRTTVLRSLDGIVHVFPNGAITTLSNVTREYSCYVFDIGVAYKEDTDRVVQLLKEVGDELKQDEACGPEMIEPVEIFGVDKFADSAVVIKGKLKTMPSKQWMVGREFNRRVKKRFDEEGIEIPFPHQSLYFGEASKPFAMKLDADGREEIKQAVREVLRDMKAETSS